MNVINIYKKFREKKAVSVGCIFLTVMLVLTIISRMTDAYMIPRVTVESVQEMRLDYPVELEGEIAAVATQSIYCEEGVRISQVKVAVNDVVEPDELLFIVDVENLEEKIENLKLEIEKAELQINAVKTTYNTQVEQRDKNLIRAQEDYNDAVTTTQNAVNNAYNSMMNTYSELENHVNSNPDNTEEAISEWETKKTELEQQCEQQQQAYNEAILEQETSLKSAARQIEDADEEIIMDSSAKSLEMDKEELETQLKRLNKIKKKEGKIYSQYYGKVTEINIKDGGTASAEAALIMEDYNQELKFEGVLDDEQRFMFSEGQTCQIKMKYGNDQYEDLKIDKITAAEAEASAEENSAKGAYQITVHLESTDIKTTGEAILSFTKESKTYSCCVPVSALYSDADGYYVFAVSESTTIMGIQYKTEKIPVEILEQNTEYAAVAGNMDESCNIITNASKVVSNKERVRVVEEV